MRREGSRAAASRRIALVGGAIIALAGIAWTPSAVAAKTGLLAELDINGADGYYVSIFAERWMHPRRRGKLTVSVSKGVPVAGAYARSAYTAHARLTRHRIKANLGSFGRIRLRFHPKAHRSEMRRLEPVPSPGSLATGFYGPLFGCTVTWGRGRGHFKGRIHFRGEDGYVRIRAHRTTGFISNATESCSNVKRFHGVALDAKSGSTAFEADRFRHRRGALFVARQREQAGPVTIDRVSLDDGLQRSFKYDSGLTSAHVEPPSGPFSGTADLNSSGEWSGSLAVSFPGAPDVPLAGPDFAARLRRF